MKHHEYRYAIPNQELYDVGNWHSPYFFQAFFAARASLFESLNLTEDVIKTAGYAMVARHLECDYFRPLLKGDVALIEIMLESIQQKHYETDSEGVRLASMAFTYAVYKEGDQTRKLHAKGRTFQALINRNTKKSAELPEWIKNLLLGYL